MGHLPPGSGVVDGSCLELGVGEKEPRWGEKKKKNQSLQPECESALKKPHASLSIFKSAH